MTCVATRCRLSAGHMMVLNSRILSLETAGHPVREAGRNFRQTGKSVCAKGDEVLQQANQADGDVGEEGEQDPRYQRTGHWRSTAIQIANI